MPFIKELVRLLPERFKLCVRPFHLFFLCGISIRRPANFIKYIFNKRKNIINFVPPVFHAAITARCNLNCPRCMYRLNNPKAFKDPDDMSEGVFSGIMNRWSSYIDTVVFSGGEPLMHPDFARLVDIAKSKRLQLKIITNGILIMSNIEALKQFDLINISLDCYDYDSFSRYKAGTQEQYRHVLEGVSLLRSKNIPFRVSFILSQENVDEAMKFIDFARTIDATNVIFHNMNPHASDKYSPLIIQSEKVKRFIADITCRDDYSFNIQLPVIFDDNSEKMKHSICNQPWYYSCVDGRGDIAYCCHLKHSRDIGNINLGYTLNSESIKKFRDEMRKQRYPMRDCYYCQRRFYGKEYGVFSKDLRRWLI
ncbi:MAG: radical SAM protein [Candidatus Omnitrophota bacterium]